MTKSLPYAEDHSSPPGKSWEAGSREERLGPSRAQPSRLFLSGPSSQCPCPPPTPLAEPLGGCLSMGWGSGPDLHHLGYIANRNAPQQDLGCSDTNAHSAGHPAPRKHKQKLSPQGGGERRGTGTSHTRGDGDTDGMDREWEKSRPQWHSLDLIQSAQTYHLLLK